MRKGSLIFLFVMSMAQIYAFDSSLYKYDNDFVGQELIIITNDAKLYDLNRDIVKTIPISEIHKITGNPDKEEIEGIYQRFYEINIDQNEYYISSQDCSIIKLQVDDTIYGIQEGFIKDEFNYVATYTNVIIKDENEFITINGIEEINETLFLIDQVENIRLEDKDMDGRKEIITLQRSFYKYLDRTFFNLIYQDKWIAPQTYDLQHEQRHKAMFNEVVVEQYHSYFYFNDKEILFQIVEYIREYDDYEKTSWSAYKNLYKLENGIFILVGKNYLNTCYINDNRVNFRENPSLGSNIIGQLDKGERLTPTDYLDQEEIIAGSRGRWIKVKDIENREGWIFDPFLDWVRED